MARSVWTADPSVLGCRSTVIGRGHIVSNLYCILLAICTFISGNVTSIVINTDTRHTRHIRYVYMLLLYCEDLAILTVDFPLQILSTGVVCF